MRAGLWGNQEETNRYYLALQGIIPPEEFFNPENLQRLKARATQRCENRALVAAVVGTRGSGGECTGTEERAR